MLFQTARQEVRERLGELMPDFWSDAYINRQLNEGVRRFCYEERWTWLLAVQTGVSITAGTATFNLRQDVDVNRHLAIALKPTGADDAQFTFPKRVQPHVGYQLRKRYVAQNIPRYYYVARTDTVGGADPGPIPVVRLIPIPHQNYVLEYTFYRHPQAFADGDDISSLIPMQYVEAPIAWATAMCWLKELNGAGKAQEQFNIYNAILAQARKNEAELSIDESVVWGGEEPQLSARTLEEELLWRTGPLG